MKATQIVYLIVFVGVILWMVTNTSMLDSVSREGFQDPTKDANSYSEPITTNPLPEAKLDVNMMPNTSTPGQLPFGPYAQQAKVGSYEYQDPAVMPATLQQMKKLYEDIRSFLVFQGAQVASSSDPTVQLPLTQLRADSRKLEQEISVLNNNPGVQSQLTQQDTADIQEALTFLMKKVRLFQTSGVVSEEGFANPNPTMNGPSMPAGPPMYPAMPSGPVIPTSAPHPSAPSSGPKTRATKADLQNLQSKVYAAILTLTASGTIDPVTQARVKALQDMYTNVTDMINKLDQGIWTSLDVPVYVEDIQGILPSLAKPSVALPDITTSSSGKQLSPLEKGVAELVGEKNVDSVLKNIQDKGSFRFNMDIGYNLPNGPVNYSKQVNMGGGKAPGGSAMATPPRGAAYGGSAAAVITGGSAAAAVSGGGNRQAHAAMTGGGAGNYMQNVSASSLAPMMMDPLMSPMGGPGRGMGVTSDLIMDGPYDPRLPGMDAGGGGTLNMGVTAGNLDWQKRVQQISEQIRKRGMDPQDFGCIPPGSMMSPAYSWRGHAKMVCGRLAATTDPGLPEACGCPPPGWKGWTV